MTTTTLTSFLVIALTATMAPLLADRFGRWLPIPTIVLEISLGILIGPAVLGLAADDAFVAALASFGLALLFFLAGYEIDFSRIRGSRLALAAGSWSASLVLGLGAGVLLAALLGGGGGAAVVFGLAVSATALGAILPIVRDAGVLPTRLGATVMAVGAVGEFAPIVTVAVLLGGERPLHATGLLVAFTVVAAAAAALAMRTLPAQMIRLVTVTLGSSGQFAVRLSILTVVAMVWLAIELHLDLVLGAFAAGVVIKLLLTSVSRPEAEIVESKLEGVGFGLFIPLFFVVTGMRFDLPALVASPTDLALVPAGLAAFLLVRAVPVILAFRRRLPRRDLRALGLYAATTLPLVVVITDGGVTRGWLSSATAAGLVGAAILSVLVFPLFAVRAATPATAGTDPTPR